MTGMKKKIKFKKIFKKRWWGGEISQTKISKCDLHKAS